VLRKEAIGIVDAFGFTDNGLKSVLGVYDGNVYELMWDCAENKNSFNKKEVIDGMDTVMEIKNVKRPLPYPQPKL